MSGSPARCAPTTAIESAAGRAGEGAKDDETEEDGGGNGQLVAPRRVDVAR